MFAPGTVGRGITVLGVFSGGRVGKLNVGKDKDVGVLFACVRKAWSVAAWAVVSACMVATVFGEPEPKGKLQAARLNRITNASVSDLAFKRMVSSILRMIFT